MSLTSPANRRLAAFVSLLYVFFSTFGALTHTHVTSETSGAPRSAQESRQSAFTLEASGPAPAHCPVCEWQSVQVTAPPVSTLVAQPTLLRIEQSESLFRLPSLRAFRSSSRGPPRA